MNHLLTAREETLKRIQLGTATSGPTGESAELDRAYRRTGILSHGERISLFEDCLRDYDVAVQRVPSETIATAIAQRLSDHGKSRVVIPESLPAAWLVKSIRYTHGDRLSALELEAFDGVVTGCTVGIAVSGSLVLQNADAQGPRQLSLIPDFHLCVIFADQIVETLPEAFERLASTATLPTTFISGPSATSDIEMTRIRGVHGPRTLDVLIAMR